MSGLRKREGSAYLLVIVVFIFVSLFSALMMSNLTQTIYQANAYGMQTQCYYLNNQAARATVAALIDNNNELIKTMSFPREDTMKHKDSSGIEIGSSRIVLKKEYHDYYGENEAWVVAEITTTIKDLRAARYGEDFTYMGTVMVLIDNPLIQLYNVNIEDFR